jgi:hypothetical protein
MTDQRGRGVTREYYGSPSHDGHLASDLQEYCFRFSNSFTPALPTCVSVMLGDATYYIFSGRVNYFRENYKYFS